MEENENVPLTGEWRPLLTIAGCSGGGGRKKENGRVRTHEYPSMLRKLALDYHDHV